MEAMIIDYFEKRMGQDKFKKKNINFLIDIFKNYQIDKINKLKRSENITNFELDDLLKFMFKYELSYTKMLLVLECYIRIKDHKSCCKKQIKEITIDKKLTEQEQVFWYMLRVIFAQDIGYNYYELMQYDVKIIDEVWSNLLKYKLPKIEIMFHIMTVSFTLMIRDKELSEKHEIESALEGMLNKIIIRCNGHNIFFERVKRQKRTGNRLVKKLKNFDLKRGRLTEIIDVFENLPIGYARNIIGYAIINKSEFLDKYAFMCLYLNNFDYEKIGDEVNKINPKMFDEKLKYQLKIYIFKYTRHRVPLYMALQRFIPKDLKKWELITTRNYVNYVKRVDYLNYWYDLLLGYIYTINLPDYRSNIAVLPSKYSLNLVALKADNDIEIITTIGRKGLSWKFFSNVLKVTDLITRIDPKVSAKTKVLRLLFSTKEELIPNIIIASKECDIVMTTAKYLAYIETILRLEHEEELETLVNLNKLQHPKIQGIVKLYLSSVDFITFLLLKYKKLSNVTRTILLLCLECEISLYEQEFMLIDERDEKYRRLLINIYKKAPNLCGKIFRLMNPKRYDYSTRNWAFGFIVSAYDHQFDDRLTKMMALEPNKRLQNVIKNHLESHN